MAPLWSDKCISNLDNEIDPGMEEDLRAGMHGEHSAWNFHGEVWYDPSENVFKEEVSVCREVRGTVSAPTLEELMAEVNSEYGWD